MNVAPALAKIAVGIVVARRKADSPWIDFTWKPVAALAGLPDAAPWTMLSQDPDVVTFYAGAAEIELYRTETTNYRDNLGSSAPMLWVALRRTWRRWQDALLLVQPETVVAWHRKAFRRYWTALSHKVR